jgi:hypothetical protein
MLINLSLRKVDSYVDIVLSRRSDVIFQRQRFHSPEKIIYAVRLPHHDDVSFQVYLHEVDEDITEITFPIYLPSSGVFPSPHPGGGTIEVFSGQHFEPSFKNKTEEEIYGLCHSIWLKVRLNERMLRPKPTDTERTKPGLNNLPPTKDSLPMVPKKNKSRNEWRARWARIKGEWKGGKSSYKNLADKLSNMDLPTSAETVAKIVKAGDAGLLDKT